MQQIQQILDAKVRSKTRISMHAPWLAYVLIMAITSTEAATAKLGHIASARSTREACLALVALKKKLQTRKSSSLCKLRHTFRTLPDAFLNILVLPAYGPLIHAS